MTILRPENDHAASGCDEDLSSDHIAVAVDDPQDVLPVREWPEQHIEFGNPVR